MIQDGNLPLLILEKISDYCSSMDVLHLSNTCQILQQKLQNEWQGELPQSKRKRDDEMCAFLAKY
jgi:hypothetical protein